MRDLRSALAEYRLNSVAITKCCLTRLELPGIGGPSLRNHVGDNLISGWARGLCSKGRIHEYERHHSLDRRRDFTTATGKSPLVSDIGPHAGKTQTWGPDPRTRE